MLFKSLDFYWSDFRISTVSEKWKCLLYRSKIKLDDHNSVGLCLLSKRRFAECPFPGTSIRGINVRAKDIVPFQLFTQMQLLLRSMNYLNSRQTFKSWWHKVGIQMFNFQSSSKTYLGVAWQNVSAIWNPNMMMLWTNPVLERFF